nr:DUF4013 domain-containing protein [uncultured Methanobacterium sp.]
MKIGEIVKDSIRYPFSNWISFLILGVFLVFSSVNSINSASGIGLALSTRWALIGLIFGLIICGYQFRILKSSLIGIDELPKFNNWYDLIINGIKVIIVCIVYFIPYFFILFLGVVFFVLSAGSPETTNVSSFFGILLIIVILYIAIIFPLLLMSLVNMAFYDGDLGAPFRFGEIIKKISNIGWDSFIVWYVVTVVASLILVVSGALIEFLFLLIQLKVIGVLLVYLFAIPFLSIYLFRSTALFYLSDDPGFLECENCGGYYQLQVGESPEDFEKCQCGGALKHTTNMQLDTRTEGSNFDVRSFIKRKKTFILVGVLALIIIAIPVILLQNTPNTFVTTEKTLIGSYDASQLDSPRTLGTFVAIPPGTTKATIEYNLSWTPAFAGVNGMIIMGYNTNTTSHWGAPDNRNIIYNEGVTFSDDDHNDKNGTIAIDNSAIKSIVISGNGVKGTVNVYAYKTKLAI